MIIFFLIICINLSVCPAQALTNDQVTAQSAVLLDQSSGRVLFAKNEGERLPMASTTKVMTALLALEKGDLNSRVVVSKRAAETEGSSIWLEEKEVKTLEELVYGLMLRSGNDAAVAIAEHLAGSVEDFSVMMTERAQELGAYNTQFKNPHGLDDEEHFTTAYDLGLITCRALEIPKFKEILITKEKKITWPGHEWDRYLRNQNKLLELYPGADGVKTGWTTPAGPCFVGSATRDKWQLVAVVLNSNNIWEDTKNLLDYGFENWSPSELMEYQQFIKTVEVEGGDQDKVRLVTAASFTLPLEEEEEELVEYRVLVDKSALKAPIKEGQVLGEITVILQGEELKSVNLLAGESINKKNVFITLFNSFKKWLVHAI
ncbi:D-alanyl-D-alanine carboxypeptidase [Candidatus Contubernalis alkalaceticus]|nr:D-alanyl-D-alanine carboxypeptidase [Candidatus Contubernalis alkalaceticus]